MEGDNVLMVIVPGVRMRVNPSEADVDVLLEITIVLFPVIAFLVIPSKPIDV